MFCGSSVARWFPPGTLVCPPIHCWMNRQFSSTNPATCAHTLSHCEMRWRITDFFIDSYYKVNKEVSLAESGLHAK